jgi:UDP-2,3-diacylglucosamine pyrophosphatase LpxH
MKNIYFILLLFASFFTLASCDSNNGDPNYDNPFDTISVSDNNKRDKIIIISDLHLGNDLSYSENVKHLKRLEEFLNEIRFSGTVKELVIGGDMFDEWYIPSRTDTYGSGTQADFINKTVAANKAVFDVLKSIIKDKKIKLTYIPGNHDMGFLPENINIALPGVNQARDSGNKYPVGTYHPDYYPQIAIEHGHRYDFFSSMTPNANERDAPGSIMPPGYFFARIAANSFTDPTTIEASTKVPIVSLVYPNNAEQYSKYVYYLLWKKVLEEVIYVKDKFDEPIIKTNVGNYTKTYSINDILPHNLPTDNFIHINLYNGLFTQLNWYTRQKYNNVSVITNIDKAIVGSLNTEFLDSQSDLQYFKNPDSNVRIVIFGHSHKPMVKSSTNLKGETCIYANSGTWEDQKNRDKNAAIDQDTMKMNFVLVSPVNSNSKKIQVALYQYFRGKHLLKDSKEVDL